MINELEKIAKEYFHFTTLNTTNTNKDFQEVSVWSVKKALEEAYKLGQCEGYKNI